MAGIVALIVSVSGSRERRHGALVIAAHSRAQTTDSRGDSRMPGAKIIR